MTTQQTQTGRPRVSRSPEALSASITIDAPVERVWEVVSDLRRMPEFSPELRRVVPLGRRTSGVGARILGINRRGLAAWPTTSRVTRWEPCRAVAWKTRESAATWVYELEPAEGGTRVTSRRVLAAWSRGTTLMAPLIGGAAAHDRELADGMATTLERIKAAVEG
ncbi:MAG TPA: SRPBCC family protein [Marmoricola sp.]|nr:SRPBCC family protein [Marmoricola sp.]